jgi:hypothetical protein
MATRVRLVNRIKQHPVDEYGRDLAWDFRYPYCAQVDGSQALCIWRVDSGKRVYSMESDDWNTHFDSVALSPFCTHMAYSEGGLVSVCRMASDSNNDVRDFTMGFLGMEKIEELKAECSFFFVSETEILFWDYYWSSVTERQETSIWIGVWGIDTSDIVRSFEYDGVFRVGSVGAINRSRHEVIACCDSHLNVFNYATGDKVRIDKQIHRSDESAYALDLSEDGKRVCYLRYVWLDHGCYSGAVHVMDLYGAKSVSKLILPTFSRCDSSFMPGTPLLAIGFSDSYPAGCGYCDLWIYDLEREHVVWKKRRFLEHGQAYNNSENVAVFCEKNLVVFATPAGIDTFEVAYG